MATGSGDDASCLPSVEELRREAEYQAIEISAAGIEAGEVRLIFNEDAETPKSCPQNYVEILTHDRYLRGKIRMNALDGRIQITGAWWDSLSHPFRDEDLCNLRTYISKIYKLQNKNEINDAVIIVANRNAFHPFADKLHSLTWDGVHRIGELLPRYLGAERSEYTTAVTKLILSGVIQRVTNAGCKFDYMPVLKDVMQGTGKSTFIRFLALNDVWFTDNKIDLKDPKKAFETTRGHVVVEIGEMQMTRKDDVEAIKAFITQTASDYREPYTRYKEIYPRQFIMIGTTNRPIYLPDDPTGNRRFLPIPCNGKKAERHPLDDEGETRSFIEQCYAEMMETGKVEGWSLVLDCKYREYVKSLQDEAAPEDSRIGRIQEYLDREKPSMICTAMIWYDAFGRTIQSGEEPKKYELTEIANIIDINIRDYQRYRGKDGKSKSGQYRFPDYGRQRAWERVVWDEVETPFDSEQTEDESSEDSEKA